MNDYMLPLPKPKSQSLPFSPTGILEKHPGIDKAAFTMQAEGVSQEIICKQINQPWFIAIQLIDHYAKSQRLDERRVSQRAIQLARLEELYAKLRGPALKGDRQAIQSILDVLSDQRALLGLDAPKETITHVVEEGPFEAFVRSVQAKRLAAQEPLQLPEATVIIPDSSAVPDSAARLNEGG